MKIGRWLAVAALLTAVAGPAAAQDDSGIYLGGSIGYSGFKDSCKDLIVPCEDHDTAWRAFAGYQFNRYVALEVGFANLGEVTGSGIFNTGTPGSFTLAVEQAWDLAAVFSIPVTSRLFGLARAGLYRARTTIDVTNAGFPDQHAAGTNSGFSYGAGAEFRLGPIGLRAEWQRWENVGTAATGEDDIDVLSLSLLLRF